MSSSLSSSLWKHNNNNNQSSHYYCYYWPLLLMTVIVIQLPNVQSTIRITVPAGYIHKATTTTTTHPARNRHLLKMKRRQQQQQQQQQQDNNHLLKIRTNRDNQHDEGMVPSSYSSSYHHPSSLTIILPSFNEEERIGQTIQSYCSFLMNMNNSITSVMENDDNENDNKKKTWYGIKR